MIRLVGAHKLIDESLNEEFRLRTFCVTDGASVMRRKFRAATAAAATILAAATEAAFRFASVVGGNGTSIAGTSPGDPL